MTEKFWLGCKASTQTNKTALEIHDKSLQACFKLIILINNNTYRIRR